MVVTISDKNVYGLLEKIKQYAYYTATMKTAIHPTYHDAVTVTCSCGVSFKTGSTARSLTVEVCSRCHPFYTGKQKLVDAAGRVDKFRKRLHSATAPARKPKRIKKPQTSAKKIR